MTDDLAAAATAFLADVSDGVWANFLERGLPEGAHVEAHVSWRCPSISSAEALEKALLDEGMGPGAAPPHAEARGCGFGVAATVPFRATRENFDAALDRAARLGLAYGAEICALGTTFDA